MSNYNPNKVNEMLEEIKKNDDIHVLLLLLYIMEEKHDYKIIDYFLIQDLIEKFTDLSTWERTNVLYKLSEATKIVVINKAKEFAQAARKEDKIKELEKSIIYIEQNYWDENKVLASDSELDKLFEELRSLNSDSKVIKEFDSKFQESKNASRKN